MAIDRKAMKDQLKSRLAEQQAGKNKGLNDFESYFEVPEGVSQWTTKPGKGAEGTDYGFDIIPFVAGSKYPTNGYNIRQGDLAYVLDVWVHFKVGPMNKPVVCPLKNYGFPCPVCEKRVEVLAERGQMEKDEFKKFKKENSFLYPSRRVMYNVIVRSDEKEEKKGIQVYEISHFFMEKKLQESAKKPRGGGLIPYPDPDEGKTIWMNFALAGEDNWSVGVPQFEDRQYVITDEEIENAQSLDELLVIYEYDDIAEMMKVKTFHVADEDSGQENNREEDPPIVVNRRKPPVKQQEEVKEKVGEDSGDQVNTTTGEVVQSGICPYGCEFGTDYDGYTECDTCRISDDCLAKKEADEAAKKAAEQTPVKKPTARKKLVIMG